MNLPGRRAAEPEADVVVEDRPVKAGGKNAPTPRRNAARAQRRSQLKGQPLSSKERRAKGRSVYNETRAAMKSTDVSQLPATERVPELVYARDLVDSRLNLGTAIIPVAVVYFLASFAAGRNAVLAQGATFLALFWFLAMVVDALVMSRALEAKVAARFPGTTVKVRAYAARRAFALKRFRRPVPREIPPGNRWKAKAS